MLQAQAPASPVQISALQTTDLELNKIKYPLGQTAREGRGCERAWGHQGTGNLWGQEPRPPLVCQEGGKHVSPAFVPLPPPPPHSEATGWWCHPLCFADANVKGLVVAPAPCTAGSLSCHGWGQMGATGVTPQHRGTLSPSWLWDAAEPGWRGCWVLALPRCGMGCGMERGMGRGMQDAGWDVM